MFYSFADTTSSHSPLSVAPCPQPSPCSASPSPSAVSTLNELNDISTTSLLCLHCCSALPASLLTVCQSICLQKLSPHIVSPTLILSPSPLSIPPDLSQDELTQLLIHLLQAWSRPSTRSVCSLFPLAVTLPPTDVCGSLSGPVPAPAPTPAHSSTRSCSRSAHEALVMPFSSEPPASHQQWVWPHSPHWRRERTPTQAQAHAHAQTQTQTQAQTHARYVPPLRLLDLSRNSLGARGTGFLRAFFSVSDLHTPSSFLVHYSVFSLV